MVKFFYDCEFLEDGRTINLISIGIVGEDSREYYAVNRDAPWKRISEHRWLVSNVVRSLPRIHGDRRVYEEQSNRLAIDFQDPVMRARGEIANEVNDFLLSGTDRPELWADCGDYDHVVLMQLWGDMAAHKPDGLPYYTRDLRQEIDRLGGSALPLPEQTTGLHNALDDARHNMVIARHLGLIA